MFCWLRAHATFDVTYIPEFGRALDLPVTKSPACVSWLQDVVNRWYEEEKSWLNLLDTFMPTVIYAIVIAILNAIYRKIAVKLNEFGNLSSSVNLALLHTGKSF